MIEDFQKNAPNSKCIEYDCTDIGRLYNWEVAKTLCPIGWGLPNKAQFEKLKTKFTYQELLLGGTSGFDAILSGVIIFSSVTKERMDYWTIDEVPPNRQGAYTYRIRREDQNMTGPHNLTKGRHFIGCRCVQNKD